MHMIRDSLRSPPAGIDGTTQSAVENPREPIVRTVSGDPEMLTNYLATSSSMKVSLLEYDLSSNSLVRSHVIAQLLELNHEVEIVGPASTGEVWSPLRDKYEYYPIETSTRLWEFPGNAGEILSKMSGDVIYARKPKAQTFGLGLYDRIRRDRPLLLDIEDWELGLMYANWTKQTAPLAGLPRLIDLDSYAYTAMTERLVGHADGVTVSNTFLQERFGGQLIPHLRNTTEFNPDRFKISALRDKFDLPTDKLLVGFTGTPRPHKGVDELATAVGSLAAEGYDVSLFIVGAGDTDYVRRLRADHGDYLLLREPRPFNKMPEWVAAADVVAAPQRKVEGLHGQVPAKIFDAISMGNPVVATAIGDIPEIVKDCGIVVDQPTPDRLADALKTYVTDPDRRRADGARARKRAVDRYSLRAHQEKIDALLSEAEISHEQD